MNIYDFRDFRKKWFALQENFARKQIKDSQVETNNKDGLEIENQTFAKEEIENWNTPITSDRIKILNNILDEMINAYKANRKFSDGIKEMDNFVAEIGITLTRDEENKLFKAYRMIVSGTATREELPPPFGSGVADSSLIEARRRIKEKKKKLQKNSKFKENKKSKDLEDLINNSKYEEYNNIEEEDDDMSAIDDVVLNSKYAEADDIEEDDDDMSAIDDVVLNSKYAEADDIEEDDDDMSAIDDVVLNSRHKKKAKKENVTSADVGSGVGKAPDAKIKKEVKKRKIEAKKKRIKEAEEFDDPKEMKNIETDVDAEMANQDVDSEEGSEDSVSSLLDQLKKKFEDKFPGKEILITVKSKDEPIDDEIVSKAKEVTGSMDTEEEGNQKEVNLDKDLENIDSESSDDLEGKVFSKGEEGSLEKEEKKDIKNESYKKTIRALRKIIMEAKEELSNIENEISKDKNEKNTELEDDLENIEKSDNEVDDSESEEKSDEPTGGSEENVDQNEITLSIDNWKKVLD